MLRVPSGGSEYAGEEKNTPLTRIEIFRSTSLQAFEISDLFRSVMLEMLQHRKL
jgi:hypothetical protein